MQLYERLSEDLYAAEGVILQGQCGIHMLDIPCVPQSMFFQKCGTKVCTYVFNAQNTVAAVGTNVLWGWNVQSYIVQMHQAQEYLPHFQHQRAAQDSIGEERIWQTKDRHKLHPWRQICGSDSK